MAATCVLQGQDAPPGRYPQIWPIIHEAELAAKGVSMLPDKSRPALWAGNLYARAGYVADARRAYSTSPVLPVTIFRAQVLYGDLAGAEKSILAIPDPDRRAAAMSSIAEMLWQTGDTEHAKGHYALARQTAEKITDPERRKKVLASIDREAGYAIAPPPNPTSAEPRPVKKFDLQDSKIPLFPITTDGFRDEGSKDVTNRATANAAFITRLYDRLAAQDFDGLKGVIDSASTPFQRAIGIASLEHLALQANQAATADEIAKSMPEADVDCILAKAEALSAAGAAWLRDGDSARANADFALATGLAGNAMDLPLGSVSVLVSIAAAEFKGGMVATIAETFRAAREIAREIPARPNDASGLPVRSRVGVHYRDEAYDLILRAAIRAHDPGLAHEVSDLWKSESASSDVLIVDAWLNANQPEEAVAFARSINDRPRRITALLKIAQSLLDAAGAPTV